MQRLHLSLVYSVSHFQSCFCPFSWPTKKEGKRISFSLYLSFTLFDSHQASSRVEFHRLTSSVFFSSIQFHSVVVSMTAAASSLIPVCGQSEQEEGHAREKKGILTRIIATSQESIRRERKIVIEREREDLTAWQLMLRPNLINEIRFPFLSLSFCPASLLTQEEKVLAAKVSEVLICYQDKEKERGWILSWLSQEGRLWKHCCERKVREGRKEWNPRRYRDEEKLSWRTKDREKDEMEMASFSFPPLNVSLLRWWTKTTVTSTLMTHRMSSVYEMPHDSPQDLIPDNREGEGSVVFCCPARCHHFNVHDCIWYLLLSLDDE